MSLYMFVSCLFLNIPFCFIELFIFSVPTPHILNSGLFCFPIVLFSFPPFLLFSKVEFPLEQHFYHILLLTSYSTGVSNQFKKKMGQKPDSFIQFLTHCFHKAKHLASQNIKSNILWIFPIANMVTSQSLY